MADDSDERERLLLRRQDVLARFGELAIRSDSLSEILQEACTLVGEALGTDLAKVMELQEDGITLLVRAGVGWRPGVVGKTTVEAVKETSEGYALQKGQPVTSADIDHEQRFTYASFLKDNGVRALANVPIVGPQDQRPYGILELDSREPRAFVEDDVSFLRTYANLLAAAVQRIRLAAEARRGEEALRESEDHFRATADLSPQMSWTADWQGGILSFSDRWLDFTGMSREETLGGGWTKALHPDDFETVVEVWHRALATEEPFDVEGRLRTSDGSHRWSRARATPSRWRGEDVCRKCAGSGKIEGVECPECLGTGKVTTQVAGA